MISGGIEEARALPGISGDAGIALDDAITASARAADLTRQLLAMGRKQLIKPRVVDLGDTVQRFQKMLRRALNDKVELRVEVPAGERFPLYADPGQLEQVLLNLAINSGDAMPHGGVLRLEVAGTRSRAASLGRRLRARGDYIFLRVSDDGEGIAPEHLPEIFEPFFTTKPPGEGTGLGLAVVHGVVSQNGGFIEVASQVGKGTTFTIYFPRSNVSPSRPSIPALTQLAAPEPGSATILLAEDEEALRNLAARTLRRRGYEVLDARDGRHALALAKSHRGPIHLLITDVVMPHMDGRALAEGDHPALPPAAHPLHLGLRRAAHRPPRRAPGGGRVPLQAVHHDRPGGARAGHAQGPQVGLAARHAAERADQAN